MKSSPVWLVSSTKRCITQSLAVQVTQSRCIENIIHTVYGHAGPLALPPRGLVAQMLSAPVVATSRLAHNLWSLRCARAFTHTLKVVLCSLILDSRLRGALYSPFSLRFCMLAEFCGCFRWRTTLRFRHSMHCTTRLSFCQERWRTF